MIERRLLERIWDSYLFSNRSRTSGLLQILEYIKNMNTFTKKYVKWSIDNNPSQFGCGTISMRKIRGEPLVQPLGLL
ncbi:MAG TPA: hypothetical protein VI278_15245 [Nitrososphaeraceae archaeon]